jgi:hypothetical protein
MAAVVSLGRFRAAPRVGHIQRLKRVYGYLSGKPNGAIRFRTGRPEFPQPDQNELAWLHSIYGSGPEELPDDMPIPKGKMVRTTTFVDANLLHDFVTGRSSSGILHFVDRTPVDWFSKKQGSVETATYGSEFVAARIAVDQVTDLRYTLRMMGIPLDGPSWMFGDNQSVITSSTIPHSPLSKRHNALAYHRVREAVAKGVVYFVKIDGKQNPADCLTKFAAHHVFWPIVKVILFDTDEEIENGTVFE